MDMISNEYDEILERQRLSDNTLENVVEDMLQILTESQEQLKEHPNQAKTTVTKLLHEIKSKNNIFQQEEKEIQAMWSKFSKHIDKQFKSGLETINLTESFNSRGLSMNIVLAHHLLRQGYFDLFEVFMKETGVEFPEEMKRPFWDMFEIVNLIRKKNLDLAIKWVEQHTETLEMRASSLRFQLYQLKFLQLINTGNIEGALAYSKSWLAPFVNQHLKEIQKLMGCLLYLGRLEQSTYAELFSPMAWENIELTFVKEYCALMGLSHDSPLHIIVMAGAIAVPILLKMTTVMKSIEWSQKDELPVEIPLSRDWRYHSVFVCPVSKEQQREDNPPMMMPCGHVILKESLMRLSKGGNKFKCPYCPLESTPTQAKCIYL
jgi:hypothetical protein